MLQCCRKKKTKKHKKVNFLSFFIATMSFLLDKSVIKEDAGAGFVN